MCLIDNGCSVLPTGGLHPGVKIALKISNTSFEQKYRGPTIVLLFYSKKPLLGAKNDCFSFPL
jgi:hypothetical protein